MKIKHLTQDLFEVIKTHIDATAEWNQESENIELNFPKEFLEIQEDLEISSEQTS
ncbi:hypothetical protein [Candidatus Nucleicultrix amoebiphila]|jgi:hypothetical protein|uniref:hypothetical protein n=1 Tax=Candidatus Nucleicultrix amoebiphila TaxID=1509244 RepID=UPI0012F4CA70|nr:hypothetical protein [Candidatus Nucleicultrix amoebiphila]